MRRLLSFVLIVGLVAMVAGCGQQTPEIKNSIPKPEGLIIRGTVRGETIDNSGGMTDTGDPLAGVVLVLDGQSTNKTDTTDSNGDYSFTGLGEGVYIVTATLEGYQRNIGGTVTIGGGLQPTSDNTEIVNDILMINEPVVLTISPDSTTTVEAAALTITVGFNEAMDPSTVRPTLVDSGLRAVAIADNQSLTTAWSADGKTLTLTTGALLANRTYTLNLDPGTTARDAAGIPLDTTGGGNTGGGGLRTGLYTGVVYRAASGGAPGAPTGLQAIVNTKVIGVTALDYGDAIAGNESIRLTWNSPTSGQVTGYRVYVSCSSGPYLLLRDASTVNWPTIGQVTTNTLLAEVDDINFTIKGVSVQTGGNYPGGVDPVCRGNAMLINDKACFRVVAYNAEGESSAATAEAQDATGPTLNPTADYGPAPLTNGYALPAVADNTQAYIAFQEPVNLTSAGTASNYSLSGGANIQSVTALTSSMIDLNMVGGNDFTVVLIDSDSDISGGTLVVLTVSGVTDLAGNAVVTGTLDTVTF